MGKSSRYKMTEKSQYERIANAKTKKDNREETQQLKTALAFRNFIHALFGR